MTARVDRLRTWVVELAALCALASTLACSLLLRTAFERDELFLESLRLRVYKSYCRVSSGG